MKNNNGFDAFMDNPYWKRIYEEAPSDELRAYYKIMFNTSTFLRKKKAEIESETLKKKYGASYGNYVKLRRMQVLLKRSI